MASRRVVALHGRGVERSLRGLGPVHVVLVPDGERFKSRSTLETVYDAFLEARLGRDGLVVALGGGVVGDLAGFAAATWMRGVDWVGIPTTLLVDGRQLDRRQGGHQPREGQEHDRGLPPAARGGDRPLVPRARCRCAQLRSGAYEILKCAILGDRALFASIREAPAGLRGWDRVAMESAIATACRIKAEVVERDEREGGLRRVLNLGHTIGHALEAVTRYRRFTHGEAVGWGLIGAAFIARRRGLLPEAGFDAIASAVDHVGPAAARLRPAGAAGPRGARPGQEGEGRARALRPAHRHRPGRDPRRRHAGPRSSARAARAWRAAKRCSAS